MRKIREVLRLKWVLGRTHREIQRACRVSHGTVSEYLKRARGMSWEEVSALDDASLEERLYPAPAPSCVPRSMPDWAVVYQEHRKPGTTRLLLWEEYRAEHPDGYGYSQFCEHYRRFTKTLEVTLRREYKAGERLEVDWAGQKLPIHDRASGEVHEASLFVACLGASHYTFARATWDETLPEWIDCHVRAFEFLGAYSGESGHRFWSKAASCRSAATPRLMVDGSGRLGPPLRVSGTVFWPPFFLDLRPSSSRLWELWESRR